MTAFEILMADLYENLLKNKPDFNGDNGKKGSEELASIVKCYIDISFRYGHMLTYRDTLRDLITKICNILKQSSYDEWQRLSVLMVKNDLHQLRRNRPRFEVQTLKANLQAQL